jgi:predicted methyltransferase
MTVVEIWPGRGWYTEILAPYLKGGGRYYAASWDRDSDSDFVRRALAAYDEKLAARPDLYGEVMVTELSRSKTRIAPPASADLVLTFRNVHNWMKRGYEGAIFEAMFEALKPGGLLGLVEHRGDPEVWQDPQALSGYVNQDYAVELAERAGFRLVASSEVNANPKDTKDHPEGVWTLPPSLRLKDRDRAAYIAIGESDRMTLLFRKPSEPPRQRRLSESAPARRASTSRRPAGRRSRSPRRARRRPRSPSCIRAPPGSRACPRCPARRDLRRRSAAVG